MCVGSPKTAVPTDTADAVLVAAVFWTWIWGPVGLILSTPLTLCLVVMGRHVKSLEFFDVMLGDRPALSEVNRFYQRTLANDPDEALDQALAAVQGLAFTQASAGRGAILTGAYCLGLGIPFVLTGIAFERSLRAFAVVKRHYGVVKAIGGGLLVVVGVLLVTGLWEQFTIHLRVLISGYTAAV